MTREEIAHKTQVLAREAIDLSIQASKNLDYDTSIMLVRESQRLRMLADEIRGVNHDSADIVLREVFHVYTNA